MMIDDNGNNYDQDGDFQGQSLVNTPEYLQPGVYCVVSTSQTANGEIHF